MSDRGTQFGYNQTIMDPRVVPMLKADNILADITHPNKWFVGDSYDNIRTLGLSYIAAGADGLFIETHPNCNQALCDANTMLPLSKFKEYIEEFYNLYEFINA